jgi:5-methylcytosine-specific restriction endonuclease McrA
MIRLIKLTVGDETHGDSIRSPHDQFDAYREAREAQRSVDRFLSKYRDDRVKEAIFAETRKRCAYCESKYASFAWGDVEHILPKERDPDRLLDYTNLTLACSICNGKRGDKEYADGDPLLHPYNDDPQEYLDARGPMLVILTRFDGQVV